MNKKILIVDDERDISSWFAKQLELKGGYDVTVAGGGVEALSLMEANQYDLVFLDLVMPDLDGVEVLRRRQADPGKYHNSPVIALTNITSEETKKEIEALGVVKFVIKTESDIDVLVDEFLVIRVNTNMITQFVAINNYLKAVGKELIYGAHLVSSGAIGISLSIILIMGYEIQVPILLLVYFVYLNIYNYNYYKEVKFDLKSNPGRALHVSRRKKWIQITPYVYTALMGIIMIFVSWQAATMAVLMTLAGILYTEFFKKVPLLGFKNYYTSFIWAMIAFVIPAAYPGVSLVPFIYFFAFIFLRGLVNTIFFDLKDIVSDRARNLKTFPVKYGKRKTLYLLHIFNVLSIIPIFWGIFGDELPWAAALLLASIVLGIVYLTQAAYLTENKLRVFSYIFIDGEYIFWPILIILGKFII